jgi:ribosomal protein S18 acetylase RimI-like enzyme
MAIEIRKALEADRKAILEISAQVWGGTDYVPNVIDKWLQGSEGVLWVATDDGVVAGFSRMAFLSGNRCWMEGIRVDPAYRGKGIGKMLTQFQIEESQRICFESCGLSSYFENYESLNIVRNHGFEEIARFKYYETNRVEGVSTDETNCISQNAACQVRQDYLQGCEVHRLGEVEFDWLCKRLACSETVTNRKQYMSYDWTFEKCSPELVRERLGAGDFYKMSKGGETAVFSLSSLHAKGHYKTVNLIDNPLLEMAVLAYAIENMNNNCETAMNYMAMDASQIASYKAIGFEVYNDENQDVFVFERKRRAL